MLQCCVILELMAGGISATRGLSVDREIPGRVQDDVPFFPDGNA